MARTNSLSAQLSLLDPSKDVASKPLNLDSLKLSENSNEEERGAYFTKPEVVNFILDLCDYTADKQLFDLSLLEPSFGDGAFLIHAVRRLMSSWNKYAAKSIAPEVALANCIFGVELHTETFKRAYIDIVKVLIEEGLTEKQSRTLADHWLVQGDFLLIDIPRPFDVVVGNPPYVRQELIPASLLDAYKKRYHTIYDRADLYIPFIERSLSLLNKGGNLGFICSDRWMKNRYGGPLRKFVYQRFHLKYYVDMTDTGAFHDDVSAYPAITVFTKGKQSKTRIAHRPQVDSKALTALSSILKSKVLGEAQFYVQEIDGVAFEAEPWVLESSDQLTLVKRLETQFPLLEETGCKVGIGVATGADSAFIGPFAELDVEPDRKLPLATTKDIDTGSVTWVGQGVINPFKDDGQLVDLRAYPRLEAYLMSHEKLIKKRHVSTKNPNRWYRTIDRITPSLAKKEKLLIPDIKGRAHIVYENGQLYPHHNLYYITSETWNIRALQAVLSSGIARLFVATYSTKMRGGYLRFQAQYLRRIRVPFWKDVPDQLKKALIEAAESNDIAACNKATFQLYNLSKSEREAIGGNGE